MTGELGRNLRFSRGKKSQREVAQEFGIDIKVISKLESGVFVPLDEETITKLVSLLGMRRDVFQMMYEQEYNIEMRRPAPAPSPLSELCKALKSLPNEDQKELVRTFLLMIQAKALAR